AGEADRQPLDRDMAVAVIMVASEILGAEFPIARHLPFDDSADHLVAVILAIRPLQQGAQIELHVGTEIILEGRRGLVETRPDRAVELRHPRADEAPFLALELALIALLEFRHAGQRTVEPIGPAVIGADEAVAVPRIIAAGGHPAVPAAIEQHIDRALLVARDDHRLGAAARQEEITVLRQLAGMTDEIPSTGENALQLATENLLARKARAAQRSGFGIDQIGELHMLCTV